MSRASEAGLLKPIKVPSLYGCAIRRYLHKEFVSKYSRGLWTKNGETFWNAAGWYPETRIMNRAWCGRVELSLNVPDGIWAARLYVQSNFIFTTFGFIIQALRIADSQYEQTQHYVRKASGPKKNLWENHAMSQASWAGISESGKIPSMYGCAVGSLFCDCLLQW